MQKTNGKRRGRPPKMSRQDILSAAIALLEDESGAKELSLRNLAQALDTAPTTIYNYYTNKEELLSNLAEVVLADFWLDIHSADPWESALEHWMVNARELFLGKPYLMVLIDQVSATRGFSSQLIGLVDLLASAGLNDEEATLQAHSLLWTVIGFVYLEIVAREPERHKRFRQALQTSPKSRMGRYLSPDTFEHSWRATIKRNMAGIVSLVEAGTQ